MKYRGSTRTIEVDIDLMDFDDSDLIDELIDRKGYFLMIEALEDKFSFPPEIKEAIKKWDNAPSQNETKLKKWIEWCNQ